LAHCPSVSQVKSQVFSQPSPLMLLPSSQRSVPSTILLPHTWAAPPVPPVPALPPVPPFPAVPPLSMPASPVPPLPVNSASSLPPQACNASTASALVELKRVSPRSAPRPREPSNDFDMHRVYTVFPSTLS